MSKITRYAMMTMTAAIASALATPAQAQVSGAVGSTVRVGTGVVTSVPRITGQVHATTSTIAGTTARPATTATSGSAQGAMTTDAQLTVIPISQIGSSITAATRALLANVSLTAEQQARVDAYAQSYAHEVRADAEAQSRASAQATTATEQHERARVSSLQAASAWRRC